MLNPLLTKAFNAGATVNAYRIVKFSSDDNTVIQGAAATDSLIGVSTSIASASAERCDVILGGVAEVTYGGNVTRGALLTSDADGKAVAAAPAAGVNNSIIGRALVSGVSGDVGCVLVNPSQAQGA